MKEIKAFIRRERGLAVVQRLRQADAPGITISVVHAAGYGDEPDYFVRDEDAFQRYPHAMMKVEVVCSDEQADQLAAILQQTASTGHSGDGKIFVSDVREVIRARDGATGEEAL